jgi:DNA-binding response OmpR family regulator
VEVLLVEDEECIRDSITEFLSEDGFRVTEAASAELALRAAHAEVVPPAVVITDVNLGPGMDGLALAEVLRRRWPRIGIVVMTGDERNVGRAPSDLRVRCMLKPLSPARLLTEVNSLLGRSCR